MILEYIGVKPEIHPSAFIAPQAIIIGNVKIEKDASIWFNTVIRGDVNFIKIGCATNIQDNSVVHVEHDDFPTIIEDHVTIGHAAIIHGCTIKHHSLIGMGATVLNGAEIGAMSVIGAGAIVPEGKIIPPGVLAVGVPARVIRKLRPEDKELLKQAAMHYVDYANNYRKFSQNS